MIENLKRMKQENPQKYNKVISTISWAVLVIVAIVILLCILKFCK